MINDTINPMNFDITKNLHGHVRVETRDRWTGRVVDSQEKNNLVTNAVQIMYMLGRWSVDNISSTLTPIYQKMLGGLLLFGGTLTESASNIYFPTNVKLIGCAGQIANSDSGTCGSYNGQESVATSNGFTTTWDFLTSQANGTIASLARTSSAFVSNQTFFTARLSYGGQPIMVNWLGYDEANQYAYISPWANTTYNGITYATTTIYRAKFDFSSVHLYDGVPDPAKWTQVKVLASSDGSANAGDWTYDKFANNFVYRKNNKLHTVAMDGTHSSQTIPSYPNTTNLWVSESYYWGIFSSTVYRWDKSNLTNVETFTTSDDASIEVLNGDAVILYAGSSQRRILYPDGTFVALPAVLYPGSLRYIYMSRFEARNVSGTYYAQLLANTHYLGTIANLDSPVTKTSSQTMKITYTLTEA